MKKTFRFAFAALAAISLASCSTDDFFGNGEKGQMEKKGDIFVEVDDLLDPTTLRAAIAPVGETKNNEWYWQKDDQIRVFGETLGKYDDYVCNDKGVFVHTLPAESKRKGPAVDAPKYALFSNLNSQATTSTLAWDSMTDELTAEFGIPATFTWGETEVGNKVDAYLSNLPTWGTAEMKEDGLHATMHFPTAVARINLANVPDNVKVITVEGWEEGDASTVGKYANMTGIFNAVLTTEDRKQPTVDDVVLDPKTAKAGDVQKGYYVGGKITVDVSNAKKDESVVYIPIIPQKYSKIKASAYAEWSDVGRNAVKTVEITPTKETVRGTVLPITFEKFELAGGDITSINDALLKRVENEEVEIKTSKITEVRSNDYILKIPNMAAKKVVINLKGLTGATDLHIVYLDNEDPYTGQLVINVAGQDASKNFNSKNIYAKLPETSVTFSGTGLQGVNIGRNNNLIVKQLTIGAALEDGDEQVQPTVIGGLYVNAEVGANNDTNLEDVIIAEGATVKTLSLKDAATTNVSTIAIEGTLGSNLDVAKDLAEDKVIVVKIGNAANLQKGLVTKQQSLTIPGQAQLTAPNTNNNYDAVVLAEGGDLIVNGKATEDNETGVKISGLAVIIGKGTMTVKGAAEIHALQARQSEGSESTEVTTVTVSNTAVVKTIDTPDADVTFNNTASSTTLVTAKTLTMNGKTSVYDAVISGDVTISNNGENEAVKHQLTMNGEEATLDLKAGYISYLTGKNNLVIKNEETYQTAIKGANVTLKEDEEGNTYTSVWCGRTISESYSAYAEAQDIYTASHLASLAGTGRYAELKTDMDLNNKNWPMIALKRSFNGGKKTIKNLYDIHRTDDNVGLFSTVVDGYSIYDLTIDNAVVTGNNNVGALVGKALGTLTVKNVTIKKSTGRLLIQTDAAAKGSNIGGVVGTAAGYPEFTNITVDGATVKGKYNLGGIIGYGETHVAVNGSQDQIKPSFSVIEPVTAPNYHAERDMNAGTVGVYVGKVTNALTVDAKHSSTGDLLKNKRSSLGFRARWDIKTYEDTTKPTEWYVWYGSYTGDVGECGQYTITGETTVSAKGWYKNAAEIESYKAANAYIQDIVSGGGTPTNSDLKF